jgi:NodT family efflux transporter outer membrane factor (OMF) lipoprotein
MSLVRAALQLTVCMIFFLQGCTMVGPDYQKPEAPAIAEWIGPDNSRVTRQPAAQTEWWKIFDDPVLNSLVDKAYQQNLTLQSAGLRILQARAQLGVAVSGLYPQLQQVGASYTNVEQSLNGLLPVERDRNFDFYQTGFDVGWELDLWGKFRRSIEASNRNVHATIAAYDDFLISLVAEVARTYVSIRSLDQRLKLARENVRIQERTLQITDVRFRAGVVTGLDVAQARALLRDTQSLIPSLEASITQAKNALSVLLGQPPDQLPTELSEPADIPSVPSEVAVGLPAELMRQRPDIQLAEFQLAAQSARIGVATADLYPHFSLMGSIGTQSTEFSRLFDRQSGAWLAGPSFSWDIFNYGRIRNRVRTEDARFQELVANYRNTVLRAAQEVEDSIAAYLRGQEQVAFLAESVSAAKRSTDLSLIQYRDGAVDFIRVLDSERFLVQQQDNLAAAQGNVVINLVSLYKGLGGGWQIRDGKPFVPPDIQKEMITRTNWDGILPEQPGQPPEESKRWWWPLW